MTGRQPHQSFAAGFTLLELLVAVALLAGVSTMAYSGFAAMLRAQQDVSERARVWNELNLALQLIEADLSQVIERPVRDALGGVEPAMQYVPGASAELRFTRIGAGVGLAPVSRIQRLGYRLEGQSLIRRVWPHPDRVQGSGARDEVLLEGVSGLTFRFIDDGKVHALWPVKSRSKTTLPRAVELVFDHAEVSDLRRVFLVQP